MEYIVLFLVSLGSFFLGRVSVKKFTPQSSEILDEARKESKTALTSRTEKRKELVIQFMKDTLERQLDLEECSGMLMEKGITRDEVEDLLNVSATTARRYLTMLESDDKIVQIGKTGSDVRYELKR